MTPVEAQALLTIAASYDRRQADPEAARAWALALDGLRFIDCREVVVEHYKRSREWLMPVDVIAGVKKIRAARLAAVVEPTPPPELAPAQANEWLRQKRREIADGEYVAPEPAVLPRRDVAALGHLGRPVNGARRPVNFQEPQR